MKLTLLSGFLALYCGTASAIVVLRRDGRKTPKWMNPADPRCGPVEPWSEHKPLEPIVGKTKEAKESQCQACKIRACNSGLPAPGKPGGCRCISYKDAAGNYATDCKNLLNKNLPVEYEECGKEARDCKALEGKCVSAKFKMDSAKEASWMKDDWKMPKSGSPKTPKWMNPADPRCGPVEPWSEHKPLEPIVGKTKEAKESQCQACKIRACNSGLPAPGKPGGCRCISYKDAAGNYATDCKNLLNKNLPVEYEECGEEARDCKALEGKCVSAKFKMDSAKEASWMKDDWKMPKSDSPKTPKWMNPADPRCGPVEPWSEHKPLEPIVGKTKEAKESQCQACKIRACNSGLPAPGKPGGCRCISYKDAAGNYATDCKNLLNKNLPVEYEECGEEARDCKALEGKCVSAKFKMDSAKEASWMKDDWKAPKIPKSRGVRAAGLSAVSLFGLALVGSI